MQNNPTTEIAPAGFRLGWLPTLPTKLAFRAAYHGLMDETPYLAVLLTPNLQPGDPFPSRLKPALRRAIDDLSPRVFGSPEVTGTQALFCPTRRRILLVFWLAPAGDDLALASRNPKPFTLLPRNRQRPLNPSFRLRPSDSYEGIELEATELAEPKRSTTTGTRGKLKMFREDMSHLFPGLVKIVRDPRKGTIKISMAETKAIAILKHRETIASRLAKYGMPVIEPATNFKLGTWRYKADKARYANPKDKKVRVYYVLTLFFEPEPGETILCNFTPSWNRKIVHKSITEIEADLRKVFGNATTLAKVAGIKTTSRRNPVDQPLVTA
jgi:hypothetical protein